MVDPRISKLARVLIKYSLAIRPGDRLLIGGGVLGLPLIEEVYRVAIWAGAHSTVHLLSARLEEIELRHATDEQLRYVSELDRLQVAHFNAQLSIAAAENTRTLGGVDPRRLALRQEARMPLGERQMERAARGEFRWCATLVPTQAYAQDAGMSLADYEEFVFGAGMLDREDPIAAWQRLQAEQQRIAAFLSGHDEIHVVAPGTDLTYRAGGRTWLDASGTHNFPDGEVYTSPREDSVNGTIRFTYPAVVNGRDVEDVCLTFESGRVAQANASRGMDLLETMLTTDEGARYVGETAFGLNYGIAQFTRNTAFDEKIGGTMHIALGQSFPEAGGRNQSGVHWDMVCDLRQGRVYADGQLCYENGRFTI